MMKEEDDQKNGRGKEHVKKAKSHIRKTQQKKNITKYQRRRGNGCKTRKKKFNKRNRHLKKKRGNQYQTRKT